MYATAPKINRPGGLPLIELSVDQVQALLRFHRLDNLNASFNDAGVDGAMLNDMVTMEDLDEIVPKLRVRKKKLLRVLTAARAEGVSIEDLEHGHFEPIAIEQEEEVTTLADDDDVDAALALRDRTAPAEGICFVGNVECTRHNVVLPKPGPLGLELCTVLLLRCKRVLVRAHSLSHHRTASSLPASVCVSYLFWLAPHPPYFPPSIPSVRPAVLLPTLPSFALSLPLPIFSTPLATIWWLAPPWLGRGQVDQARQYYAHV